MQVIEPEAIHRGVSSRSVEVRGIHLRQLAPRSQTLRRNVLPVLAAVVRYVNQPVVGASPDQVCVFRRRSNRIDHAAMLALRRIGLDKRPQSFRLSLIFTSQVGADDLPT